MPIVFDDADLVEESFDSTYVKIDDDTFKKAKVATFKVKPDFFDSNINGNGKSARGVLHSNMNPQKFNPQMGCNDLAPIDRKHTSRNGEIKVRYIPTQLTTERFNNLLAKNEIAISVPEVDQRIYLGTYPAPSGDRVFSAKFTPQCMQLTEEGDKAADRKLLVRYRMDIFAMSFNDATEAIAVEEFEPNRLYNGTENFVTSVYTTNPVRSVFEYTHKKLPIEIDEDEFDKAMDDYNIANELIDLAEAWRGDAFSDMMKNVIPQLATVLNADVTTTNDSRAVLADQFRYMDSYEVNLHAYQTIYNEMLAHLDLAVSTNLAKANLNLQFANMTEELRAAKPNVPLLPDIAVQVNPFFSKQQAEVIATREPFVIVQSGAGTGKSTTVDGRLEVLNQYGIKDEDIMVTSFTNTAADNIKNKRPNIRSMTMASMIHEIYSKNYPTHELSSIETLCNCLRIALPNSVVARDLETRLYATITDRKLGSFTALSAYVESHFDEIMTCLDAVRQTTLELESIVCYQRIDDIVEPDEIRTNFMIIDEVQDNSVFEFVYVLKRAAKYRQQLYLVGDPSQVMYEFRNANPKALNAMENSGVFATYKLTTNYRSNQDVLNFANKFLLDIEANQFANIQLHSYKFDAQTIDTLKERVQIKYLRLGTLKEFDDNFENYVGRHTSQFIDDALERGEKVAFLARTRRHSLRLQKMLEESYPNQTVASMVPDVARNMTGFTNYIRKYWDSVLAVPPTNVAYTIYTQMKNLAEEILGLRSKSSAAKDGLVKLFKDSVDKWWTQNHQIIATWVQAEANGVMTREEFLEAMKNSLVEYEINTNRIRASVISQRNSDTKAKNAVSNASLIVSTVHSVKGLEFDNVVVIYEEKAPMPEDLKRLYYVAFTRAKNQLFVLGHGKTAQPPLTTNYAMLIKELEDLAAQATSVDDDGAPTIDDDEIIRLEAEKAAHLDDEDAAYDATGDDMAALIGGFSSSDSVNETEND